MRCSSFVICVALGVGCADREVAELERVKETVCGCKAKLDEELANDPTADPTVARQTATACADAALKQVPQGEVRSSHRAQKIARDMLDCLAKIYERPETPEPDAPNKPIIAPGTSAPASARTP